MRGRRHALGFETLDLRLAPSGASPMLSGAAGTTQNPPWVDLSGNSGTPEPPYLDNDLQDSMVVKLETVYLDYH